MKQNWKFKWDNCDKLHFPKHLVATLVFLFIYFGGTKMDKFLLNNVLIQPNNFVFS
jgi:hypothetical protein